MTTSDTCRRAIIIGATSGIGLEVARVLANKGWTLGIAGRRVERLEKLKEDLPNVAAIKQIDITDDKAPQGLHDLIAETGGMDLYFHSSGIGWQNQELDIEKEIQTTKTNVVGFTRMVTTAFHYFAAHKDRAGHIAVISSIAGTKGLGAAPTYSSTKRYQNHYMECLEQLARMKELNIYFTDIRPGFVATDLIKDGHYPMKLHAEDVARTIVKAIEKKKTIVVIDWKYRLLVFFWQIVPRCLWKRLCIAS